MRDRGKVLCWCKLHLATVHWMQFSSNVVRRAFFLVWMMEFFASQRNEWGDVRPIVEGEAF